MSQSRSHTQTHLHTASHLSPPAMPAFMSTLGFVQNLPTRHNPNNKNVHSHYQKIKQS